MATSTSIPAATVPPMPAVTPFIPDNAPFTPEQRSWLNGFLAGVFAPGIPTAVEPAIASLQVSILYASQSGTGEGLARKLAKELKSRGHASSIAALESYTPATLAVEEHVILIASTYGEGEPPDAVVPFYEQLCMESAPRMEKLSYALLALGDSNYEHFCKFGADLDNRLISLGAHHIFDRVECDVELDEPFSTWKSGLLDCLTAIASPITAEPTHAVVPSIAEPQKSAPLRKQTHTRENPFPAALIEKRALTQDVSSKLTLHLAFSLKDSAIHYEAGDALGVIPQNDPSLVAGILQACGLTGSEMVELPKSGSATVFDALTHSLQITRLSRKIVDAYATRGQCHSLLDLLIPEQQTHFDKYISDRGLIDLLREYPGVLTSPAEIAALLPKLAPRLYSISSSPAAHRDEVHTTVAVVRYRAHNKDRGGVCSTLFADRTSIGDSLPVYIQPNSKFRLPINGSAPVIMIGPGTGIAPFRSFLHERRALGATGKNWLFFGERSATTDFLYREELESMSSDGLLTQLDLAFSRDQEHKIYVQDKMLEQAPLFWSWLQEGASIYVCGDAQRMAKDVDATLHSIVEQEGGMDAEAAKEFIQALKDRHRYHRDIY